MGCCKSKRKKDLFFTKSIGESSTHDGVEPEEDNDSCYYNPKKGVKHEYTLIFLHGLGDSAQSFYYHIFT